MSIDTLIHDDLASLYQFNRWADGRVIEALRRLSPERYAAEPAPGWTSVRATVVHYADAATIWARRLRGESVTARRLETEAPTIVDAETLLREGHEAFERLLSRTTPEQLATIWTYHNLQGEPASLPLWTVYRHVVNHASYHRGQVASKLHLLGGEPPSTDLIHWAIARTANAGAP